MSAQNLGMIRAVILAFLSVLSAVAGQREDAYFEEKCLPVVRDFIRRNRLAYDADFPTNKISHHLVDFTPDSRRYSSRMMLEKHYAFLFLGSAQANAIIFFHDKLSAWSFGLLEPENEQTMRGLAARTNLLNRSTALEMARRYFRLQGHSEKNFRAVKFEQVVWAESVPSKRIVLPFYEAEWLRLDADPSNDSIPPSVRITISGLESNMVHYSKISLPIKFGQDWDSERKPGNPKSK